MIKQRSKVIKLSLHLPQKKTFFVNFQLKSTKKPSKMRVFSIISIQLIMLDFLERQLKSGLCNTIYLHANGHDGINELRQ